MLVTAQDASSIHPSGLANTGDQSTNQTRSPAIVAGLCRGIMNFNIDTSINAYLAMKAILIKAKQTDGIRIVAIPGLCTGIGRMQPVIAAR